jgi:hypothetical protein
MILAERLNPPHQSSGTLHFRRRRCHRAGLFCLKRKICWSSSHKPLTDVSTFDSPGPPGIIGFGFSDDEITRLQEHFRGAELRLVSGRAACRCGVTVGEAASLLEAGNEDVQGVTGDRFECFSRVILFSGLPGGVIEGLVEVWPGELTSGLISFAYLSSHMMGSDLETTLLKIIKASDANEEDNNLDTSKKQLNNLLNDLKQGGFVQSKQKNGKSPRQARPHKGFG